MNVMIVAKQDRENLKKAKNLGNYFHDAVYDINTAEKIGESGSSFEDFKDGIIITLGGDGTLLWASRYAISPILPVRTGGVGFLCTTEYLTLIEHIEDVKNERYFMREVRRLKCNDYHPALNEIVIARRDISKIFNLVITVGKENFEMIGDGIIFSTSLGSTAYAHSAGGPVIDPMLNVINMVPVSSLSPKIGALVFPIEREVTVRALKDGILVIDGQWEEEFHHGEKFIIREGEPLKLILFSEDKFYSKLKGFLRL